MTADNEDTRFKVFTPRCQHCGKSGKHYMGQSHLLYDGYKWEMICWDCARKKYYASTDRYCPECEKVVPASDTQSFPLIGTYHKRDKCTYEPGGVPAYPQGVPQETVW